MKLSVIIPVYNGEKTVRDTLSAISMTALLHEVIVVDDGSTDGTWPLLSQMAESDPALRIFHQENAGPAAARNLALREARGEYIMFCDGDDLFLPGMPEQAVEEAQALAADLLLTGFVLTAPGQPGAVYASSDLGSREIPERLPELYRKNLLNQVWAKVFRRDLIEGMCFSDRKWGEDRLFLLEALARAKTPAVWSQPVYEYRQHTGSLISRFLPEKVDACRAADLAFRETAATLGAWNESCREAADYMLTKSLWSCLTTLFSPSCPLSRREKKAYVADLLAGERGQERRYPADCGKAFQALARVMEQGSPAAVLATARAVAALSGLMPSLARRAKHAYNR